MPPFPPSLPSEEPLAGALARYVTGEPSVYDEQCVRDWLARDPEHQVQLEALQEVYRLGGAPSVARDVDLAWARVARNLVPRDALVRGSRVPGTDRQIGFERPVPGTRDPRPRLRAVVRGKALWYGIAGAALMGVIAITQWPSGMRSTMVASDVQRYETRPAQRATFQLADGSRVILGFDSRLEYQIVNGERTATLYGQAYFTVEHDLHAPFIVRTSGVATRVLGTAFAVRAYPDDSVTQVAVAEGKVAMEYEQASAILLAGDVGHAGQGRMPFVTQGAPLADALAWTSGRLAFNKTSLRAAVSELQRRYDITITVADRALLNRHMTLTLTDESAEDAIHTVATVLDIGYVRNGHTFTFLGKK